MKNKYLFLFIIVLSMVALWSSKKSTTSFFHEKNEEKISVYEPDKDVATEMDLESYVLGVVAAEMPASFHEEALKAQAIAARSYAVYKMEHATKPYHVVADISNQAYIDEEQMKEKWGSDFSFYYEKIKNCVEETKGKVMFYNNQVIEAFYFSMSNGKTEDAQNVFGEKKEYLSVVDSSWDTSVRNFLVINKISKEDFCQKLKISCDTISIRDVKKSLSGRVETIVINNKTFKGTYIRRLLDLRSTDFVIDVKEDVEITTKGYGHGVGMSQYGAQEQAKQGRTYEEILHHYYQNVEIDYKSV